MLVLASLAATAAIPAYFSRSEVTLDNAARLLVDDLRQAQISAVYRSAPVDVRFEPDGDGYTVIERGAPVSADGSSVVRRYSRDAVFEGVRVSALPSSAGNVMSFDANGTATPGGSLTITYHGDARTILVDAKRGTIRAPELEVYPTRPTR